MRLRIFPAWCWRWRACSGCPARPRRSAEPDGDVEFVCGPVSPEDLIAVPESPWVIVSSMEKTDTSPRPTSATTTPYGCFRPHRHRRARGTTGRCTACVPVHRPISTAHMGSAFGRAATTHTPCTSCATGTRGDRGVRGRCERRDAGAHLGRVRGGARRPRVECRHPAAGWRLRGHESRDRRRVGVAVGCGVGAGCPAGEDIGPNGLEVSADGRWFYVAGYGAQAVIRLSRGQTPVRKDSVSVGFNIDNVHLAPDGSLLAAGTATPTRTRVGECMRDQTCDGITSRVARVDVEAMTAREIFTYPTNDYLLLGTGAIRWVTSCGWRHRRRHPHRTRPRPVDQREARRAPCLAGSTRRWRYRPAAFSLSRSPPRILVML